MCRVYDDRSNESLFESEKVLDCAIYMNESYDEDSEDFSHIWLDEINK